MLIENELTEGSMYSAIARSHLNQRLSLRQIEDSPLVQAYPKGLEPKATKGSPPVGGVHL